MNNISFFKRFTALLVIALVVTALGALGLEWVKASTGGNGFTLESGDLVVEGGKVGIGTTDPKRGLHIQTPENHTSIGAGILMSGGLSGNANIELRNQSGGTPYIDFSNDVAGDYDMRIRQTGEDSLAVEGGNLFFSSDFRLKKNIQTLKNSLTKITQLRGVSFKWKDAEKSADTQIGVIAQEVEKVFPELVSEDEEGYKSVAYDKFVGILIETTKELKTKNDELQIKNSEFEARIKVLEARL